MTVRMPRDVEISVPYADLVETVSCLGPEEFVQFVADVEDYFCDWKVIDSLKQWADRRHRALAQDEVSTLAAQQDRCVQSGVYHGIWGHVDPHKGCVLR